MFVFLVVNIRAPNLLINTQDIFCKFPHFIRSLKMTTKYRRPNESAHVDFNETDCFSPLIRIHTIWFRCSRTSANRKANVLSAQSVLFGTTVSLQLLCYWFGCLHLNVEPSDSWSFRTYDDGLEMERKLFALENTTLACTWWESGFVTERVCLCESEFIFVELENKLAQCGWWHWNALLCVRRNRALLLQQY